MGGGGGGGGGREQTATSLVGVSLNCKEREWEREELGVNPSLPPVYSFSGRLVPFLYHLTRMSSV